MAEEQTRDAPPLASRFGLVRPLQGRYVAGVCAALGRATGTDPVLWRVVLAVLVCFLGTGVVIYLIGWLLTPEEGDTASPLEALLGRGYSGTSPVLVVLLGVVTVFLLILILPRPLYLVLAGVTVLAALLLISRARAGLSPVAPLSPAGSAGTGYRPPFAPYGPFAGPPPPAPPDPAPPATPRAPRERSTLPALIFSAMLGVLGGLGMFDLTGVLDVPAAGYLAAGLAVVGAGLLIGAWLGRARPLIALGIVLALALSVVHAAGSVEAPENLGDLSWNPQSRAELADEYALAFGSGTVDLRQVDFSGQVTEVAVRISFGEMEVLVPPEVAVMAMVRSQLGDAQVLGQSRDGVTESTVRDAGSGDPADGVLRLDLQVRFGDLRVSR